VGVDADDAECRDAIALARGDSRPLPVDLSGDDLWRDGAGRLYARAGRRPQQLARGDARRRRLAPVVGRSEEHTSELQSLMRISYAVFCLKKQKRTVTTS